MKYWKYIALAGALAFGAMKPATSQEVGNWNIGVAPLASDLANDSYRLGWGVNGLLGYDQTFSDAMGVSTVGIRGNYVNYQIEGDEIGSDLNEGAVNLEAVMGPNSAYFQPKLGGHAGYARLESDDFFDVGVDVMATYKFNPSVGINAQVIPSWYLNQDQSEYLTKMAVGVEWKPGV